MKTPACHSCLGRSLHHLRARSANVLMFGMLAAVVACAALMTPADVFAQQAQATKPVVSAVDMVIFDNSREQFWTPFDVGFFGYSELAVALKDSGFLVTEVNLPVTLSLQVDPRGSVFVMGPAAGQTYTQKEIDAVVNYVSDGGGLLLLAESVTGSQNFQNALASRFGMSFTKGSIVDNSHSASGTAGQWIFARSRRFSIDSVLVPVAVPMVLTQRAFPVLGAYETASPENGIVAGAVEYGKGRVICIGDSQFLVNGGDGRVGIDSGKNREFALAVFNWLAGREKAPTCRIVPEYTVISGRGLKVRVRIEGTTDLTASMDGGIIDPEEIKGATGEVTFTVQIQRDGSIELLGSDGARKTILTLLSPAGGIGARLLLDVRGYGPDLCDPINGLSRLAGLMRDKGYWVWGIEDGIVDVSGAYGVIVINPLRSEGHVYSGDIRSERLRWVFINDPYTSIAVHNSVGQWFRDNGFSDREVPVHTLTSEYEIQFLPYTVFETDLARTLGRHRTFPKLDFGNETPHSFRCALVEAVGGTPFLVGSPTAWGLEGGLGLRPELAGTAPGKDDFPTRPVTGAISLSGNAVAIGDLQIFGAQHILQRGNWSLALELADWMAGRQIEIPGEDTRGR